jgi:aldehyde dehydrogenase (NAD+)
MHDKFVDDLARKAVKIPLGNPLDQKTQLGPLMTDDRLDEILAHVKKAKAAGATVYRGGEKIMHPGLQRGNFVAPTTLTDVKPNMAAAHDELFGPILSVLRYATVADAIEMANDSDYGLAGYVWANGITKATRIAHQLESGNVFINGYQSEIPFGGYKVSGMGREHGSEVIHEYTQVKSITVGLERFQSRFHI